MAATRDLLNDGEELILDLRPHWIFLVPSGTALVAVVILGLVVAFWRSHSWLHNVIDVGSGVLVLAALIWAGSRYLTWRHTLFVLTSDRVLTRRGVLAKSGVEIPLERINTVHFNQSIIERMVGAGDLTIESASERGSESFTDIRKPSVVQKEIYVQMESNENRKFDRMRGPGGQPMAPAAPAAPAASIPEQIEQLSALHQKGVLSDAEFQAKKQELLGRM